MCDECGGNGPPKGGFWESKIATKASNWVGARAICDECDGDGPPKCGFWGNKVATKPRKWVGARAKFATNVMETAYRNVAAVGRNRGAPGRDSAPISQSPNPLQNKQGICKERGHPGVQTPEKPKESRVPWLNVGFLTPARLP